MVKIDRVIIEFEDKVYSVLIDSYEINTYITSNDSDKVKICFIGNPIIKSFHWWYKISGEFIKRPHIIVDFLDKPHILVSIRKEKRDGFDTPIYILILRPLLEPPILPPARFEPISRVYSSQEFPRL